VVERFDAKIAQQHDETSQATDARRDVRAGLLNLNPVLAANKDVKLCLGNEMFDTISPPHLTTNSVAFGLGTPDFHLQII
jgi:hypothetical protein